MMPTKTVSAEKRFERAVWVVVLISSLVGSRHGRGVSTVEVPPRQGSRVGE